MDESEQATQIAHRWLEQPPDMMGDPDCRECVLARQLLRLSEALVYVSKCLDKSVELQSHYATLLNTYDGGKRLTFKNGDAWMIRLRHLEN